MAGEEHAAVLGIGDEHVGLLQDAVDVDLGGLTRFFGLEEVDRLAREAGERGKPSEILLGHGSSPSWGRQGRIRSTRTA
jgi:hypothetical protein